MIQKNKFPFWDMLVTDTNFVTHKRYKMIGVDEKRIPTKSNKWSGYKKQNSFFRYYHQHSG